MWVTLFNQVTPAAGTIIPDHIAEVIVHEDFQTLEEFVDGIPQNWWCEDARDKEAILVVKVRGKYSMDTKSHRVRVRHCISSRRKQDSAMPETRQFQETVLHRSNIQSLRGSYDVVNHLRNLQSP